MALMDLHQVFRAAAEALLIGFLVGAERRTKLGPVVRSGGKAPRGIEPAGGEGRPR